MKKFIGFLTKIGVLAVVAYVFFTATPAGKNIWSAGKDIWANIITKVDTVETVDNTDNTGDTTEPETNSWNWTKKDSITVLKKNYREYQSAISKNDIEGANEAANSYAIIAKDSKKTWKDFASLMEAEGLPESLPIIEIN
jgi:hypothetical protein